MTACIRRGRLAHLCSLHDLPLLLLETAQLVFGLDLAVELDVRGAVDGGHGLDSGGHSSE